MQIQNEEQSRIQALAVDQRDLGHQARESTLELPLFVQVDRY
jgi:hypothetical protein